MIVSHLINEYGAYSEQRYFISNKYLKAKLLQKIGKENGAENIN